VVSVIGFGRDLLPWRRRLDPMHQVHPPDSFDPGKPNSP